MDRWSQLSLKDKSDLMSLYIQNGISSLEEIKKHYNSFATGGQMNTDGPDDPPKKPLFKQSQEQHYDRNNDIIYAQDSVGEGYQHEYFHARPDTTLLNNLRPYYENLNDNRLIELGADLPFVKRVDNDPNYFYSPEEIGARVSAARYMLNKAGIDNIDIDFLRNARQNELQYGDNFRDLLHMYNDENLLQILNTQYSKGGHLYQDGGPIKKESNYSVGRVLDGIYRAVNREEFMGEPSHKYQFIKPEYVGLSKEELDSLVGQADERGHRLDIVKAEAHPSHYSRGAWSGNDFELTDKGLAEINHTYFGLNDGGQDPQAKLTYKGSTVLPEITITPDGAYIYNTYDNIKLHLKQRGGSLGKITPYGQWEYPHQVTTIPSNNITMKGVNYPVIGVSNTGDTKYMLPNMDYLFEGQYVTEYPAKSK